MSEYGRRIWEPFRPYDVRHWCAVARLIETKVTSGRYDTWFVKNWLGHEDLKTTEGYIHFADLYYRQYPYSWLKHALRPHKSVAYRGGKHEALQSKGSGRNRRFLASLPEITPYNMDGPAEALGSQQEKIWGEFTGFLPTLPHGNVESTLTKIFFFFIFYRTSNLAYCYQGGY